MFTAAALAQELKRLAGRAPYHSISIGGRDPLANAEYLQAMFAKEAPPLPVMLNTTGERPDELPALIGHLALLQVSLEGNPSGEAIERAMLSIGHAHGRGVESALVLCPDQQTTDAQLLRTIEQAHTASDRVQVVVHPPAGVPIDTDRRWIMLLERAATVHPDTRLLLRIPAPVGLR